VQDLNEALSAAILDERKRLQPRMSFMRLVCAVLLLVGFLAGRVTGGRLANVQLRWMWAYFALAMVIFWLPRAVPAFFRWVPLTALLVDLPLAFLILRDIIAVATDQAGAAPFFYFIIAAASVVGVSVTMSPWLARLQAVIGMILVLILLHDAGLHRTFWPSLLVVMMGLFVAVSAEFIGRAERLALRFAREQRETSLLNEELKRQIADRAGQLASAIARLSSAPRALELGALVEDRYRVRASGPTVT
jgi:hypothetical protein